MPSLQENLSILVIEDNPGDFVLIQEYLMEEMDPSEIQHAQTFDEAEQQLRRDDYYDIILLDLTLPDASGESLVENVTTLSEETPVIVLTGYENKEFGLETLSLGVADYLLKDELTPFLLSKSISYSIERNRINESLRQSEKQYRQLFDLSPLPKWVYDVETLAFIDVNQRAIDHYGYSRDEFLSMTIKDLWPGQDNPVLEQTLEESLNTDGIHESGIHHHKTKSGQLIEVDIRSTMITYNSGRAKMVVADDVTDRLETEKQLALSEKRFKSLVQDGADIISILDENYSYKYMSPTYETVLGMDPDDYTGTSAKNFVHEDDQQQIIDQVSQLSPKESVEVDPYRFKDTNGNWHWLESTITNMFHNPSVEGYVVNSRDVTESLEQERKLQESLELYEYVTKATDDVVYDWDVVNDVLEWDDSFHEKFVYDIEEGQYTIDYWAQNVHPEDLADAQRSLNGILDDPSRKKWEQEYRFKMQDGSYATVFERGFIIRNANGKAIRMIGSLQDISERKEYEEKLEELALVASKTTDIIVMTSPNDRITWVNDAFEELTGYSMEEAVGQNPGDLLQGPETNSKTAHHLGKAVREQTSVQDVILNYSKTGDSYWLDITIDPIFDNEQQCQGFIAIQKDVTEQIERQRKLQESVERYDIVSKATSDTIWDLNLETDTNRYNSNIYNMFGYQKQEVKNPAEWWRSKIHPDDRADVVSQINAAVEADTDRFQMEYRFECADGSYKYIYDRAFIVKDDDGKPIRMIGAMQDVTQQRNERKWLQLFESAIASTKESVAIIEAEPSDRPGRKILYVNEAFCQMTGYTAQEVKGETLNILNGPATSKKAREELSRAMANWEMGEAEFINYKKSGEKFWIRVSMTPVRGPDSDYNYWVCVGRDITERKEREDELRQSLEEKETLLLEIHHRVKNNLAVVSGMMQLQAYQEEDHEFKDKLFNSVSRIQTMGTIHELLYQSESFANLNFQENIKKLASEITDTFQTDTSLTTRFDLQQIPLNINQAIPCSLIVNEVVTNSIKHAFEDQPEGQISIHLSNDNGTVYLEVSDNGQGLPTEILNGEQTDSLGFKLIDTLAKQLEANYKFQPNEDGTTFTLDFEKADISGIGNIHLD